MSWFSFATLQFKFIFVGKFVKFLSTKKQCLRNNNYAVACIIVFARSIVLRSYNYAF